MDRHGDFPVSSQQSAIDELLSAMLVPYNGQLIPASSVPSRDGSEDAHSTSIGAGATAASDQSRHAGGPHVSIRAYAPRVKDTGTSSRTGEYGKLPTDLKNGAGGVEFCKTTTSSPPGSAEAALQSKLSSSQRLVAEMQLKASWHCSRTSSRSSHLTSMSLLRLLHNR
ncbi:hypothetical protein M409DRAFT_51828 [Zasmidium cellare ATCC 36951]|uniref:Uncharacterized protein n=1 Tax=Zasmidium cellare ATCC 36951 TaxID=1080233 RepID=A0A6A6CV32_ZASCE|nr:uncharacterized protein M409DRAFT_51828 [Zasmidium cellare ATCC 36951]KAF2170060.1 hypothetical protein M409DRAFT_51828 [Zasmidium cellare ATCC 36951]